MTDILKEAFDKYLDEMEEVEEKGCECGAVHTTFPKYHYVWCRMWAVEGGQ